MLLLAEMLNCDDEVDRGYFQSPTARSNRIAAEVIMTRADVLSYRGNGRLASQLAMPNTTLPLPYSLDLHASHHPHRQ